MPTKLPKHPALMLRDILLAGWDPDATSGLDPEKPPHEPDGLSLNRGWYNTIDFDPHVALIDFREPVSTGGNSGYSGIDPSGDGATQTRLGHGTVHVFAEGDREYGTDGIGADDIVFKIRQEIEDVIMDAENDPTTDLPGPWTHVSSSKERAPNDTDVTPTVFREQVRANYSWQRMP